VQISNIDSTVNVVYPTRDSVPGSSCNCVSSFIVKSLHANSTGLVPVLGMNNKA
jgi:hypothetical protein